RTPTRCRERASSSSPSGCLGVAQRTAGLGQEHVVEAGPVQLDRAERHPRTVQRAQDLRDGRGARVDVQPYARVDGLQPADVLLVLQQLGRRRGAPVQAYRHDITGDLALQFGGRALGYDHAVVDDRDAVAERVRLFEVVRGD